MLKRSKTFAAIVAASLSLGLTALAAPAIDNYITQGYDSDETALVFGVSAGQETGDPLLDCDFSGEVEYTLGEPEDGSSVTPVTITGSTPAGDGEEFDVQNCLAYQISVEGPNGQVNHGTFQSSWVHALKDLGMQGKGCLVSAFSKLGHGKGDESITVSEAKAAAEAALLADPTLISETPDVELEGLGVNCDKGKDKAPGLSSSDGEKPAKGPAWKTDDSVARPGNGKDK
jgi:hypothetical protein